MLRLKKTIYILPFLLLSQACGKEKNMEEREDFKSYFDSYDVKGSLVIYDEKNDVFTVYNSNQLNQPYTPASTFKIPNSLIALETGVAKNEDFTLTWDSVNRDNPNWNRNTNLKEAFKNSTVWYYQELARRVGQNDMKKWLDSLHLGNADTSGGIDQFWLNGSLRITPMQQIEFLKNLHNDKLPFKKSNMDIVKNIMLVNKTDNYSIYAKTGWGEQDSLFIGWYVGFIETDDNVYYFVNCIQNPIRKFNDESKEAAFDKARKEIVFDAFKSMGIMPATN